MNRCLRSSLLAVTILSFVSSAFANAQITIVNGNLPNIGFNDATPATPVGGNPGTTIGAQRLNVFRKAAEIWGGLLDSNVEIVIRGTFEALSCDATSATLGSAGPRDVYRGFDNSPQPETYYHAALANKIARKDLGNGKEQISARFNSKLGQPGCLETSGWYHGYDSNHGSKIDLLAVLLHEFAHGLGFSTFVNKETGELLEGHPDIYSTYMFDNTVNLHWDQMTNDQRAVSATNTGKLVWDGQNVTRAASTFLGPKTVLEINSPVGIAGKFEVGIASFGPPFTLAGLSGTVVQALDPADAVTAPAVASTTDGCSALTNGSALRGNVALIDRGGCTFVIKVKNAQDAGARGVIIVENVSGAKTADDLGGTDASITIPAVRILTGEGNKIKGELTNGVTVTIRLDPNSPAGADLRGRVKLYAPDPVIAGSSLSHWDVSASPNLLMEPNINGDLTDKVDLTLPLFVDIGWFGVTAVPPVIAATKSASLQVDRDSDGRADPGDTIRYTIVVKNSGGNATGVSVADTLDPNTTVVPGSATTTLGSIGASSPLNVAVGDLTAGNEATVRFDVTVNNNTATSVSAISNQASVSGSNFTTVSTDDPSTGAAADATRTLTNFQSLTARLSVAELADSGSAGLSVGDTLRYTLVITNAGVTAAQGVSVSIGLPSLTLDPASRSATQGTFDNCQTSEGCFLNFQAGTIASGASVTVTFNASVASVPSVGAITVQGTVTGTNIPTLLTDDPTTSTVGDATTIRVPGARRRSAKR